MLIFVRHSKDTSRGAHRHDGRIVKEGKKLAERSGRRLVKKYGTPDIIYCSPFQRTRETMESMIKGGKFETRPSIILDTRLSRYFSGREKQDPSIFTSTEEYGIPINESWNEFKYRVRDFIKDLEKKDYFRKDIVVWVITHALVYKEIARKYRHKLPEKIPFMDYFRVSKKEHTNDGNIPNMVNNNNVKKLL